MILFKNFINRSSDDYSLVLESPQIINSFKFDPRDFEYVVNSKDNKHLSNMNGLQVFKRQIGHGDMYLAIKDDKLVYVSNIFANPLLGMKVQFQVWRDKGVAQTKDLPIEVFFKHILRDHKLIFTDTEQTPDGERLWENIIIRGSKDPKIEIGIITPSTQLKYDPKEDINKWPGAHRVIIWGRSSKYKSIVAYITTNKGLIR